MEEFDPETQLIRGGLARSSFGETAEAIYMTSGFVYQSAEAAEARFKGEEPGFIYSRYGNPTVRMFEERLAGLDGAELAYATASGMAAVFNGLLACVKAGDHVLASRVLFGSCFYIIQTLLPRYGVETSFVDSADPADWAKAMRPNTKVVFLETPANPTLALLDLKAIADIAHAGGARLMVDNALASPIVQRPFEFGADIVVYSATKHIDGQGRCLGGAILADKAFLETEFQPFLRHTGPALSPFNAWVLVKGLETLALRVERQSETALKLARRVEAHGAVKATLYPFLESHPQHALARSQMTTGGTLLSLDLGSKAAAFAFLNALEIVDISNNLGDAKSLATHPATTTHRALPEADRRAIGIGDGLVRVSIGLESEAALARDFERALDAAHAAA
ncbi:O-succinylhomoserine sulfhydrylase [Aliidongia dinghuensis]|uniref:O-succinylhomoserine sulfhydrylase n=1 Tax=Aliidongia dinghuensis TaxID=1867774 RepID=A0A8J2YZD6_9PROT|nr:O-succinylhomoserine sulfhydrylase [Aliidongia dinghuensis]GGF35648.1 O-succinylhomoserine sulfhydrylase [Aliidongia dinghuensis]